MMDPRCETAQIRIRANWAWHPWNPVLNHRPHHLRSAFPTSIKQLRITHPILPSRLALESAAN